jgi:phage gp45-like
MESYELYPLVRQIVREEFAQAMMGRVLSTEGAGRATVRRFQGEPGIDNTRLIQPYGFTSRPKAQTEAMLLPVNGDATHLTCIGQFDGARPDVADGESCLYGPDGQVVFMKVGGEIHLGSKTSTEPAVLGNVLKAGLTAFVDAFLNAAQLGFGPTGPVFLDPGVRAALTAFISTYVTTASTNVVAKKIFVERGA